MTSASTWKFTTTQQLQEQRKETLPNDGTDETDGKHGTNGNERKEGIDGKERVLADTQTILGRKAQGMEGPIPKNAYPWKVVGKTKKGESR